MSLTHLVTKTTTKVVTKIMLEYLFFHCWLMGVYESRGRRFENKRYTATSLKDLYEKMDIDSPAINRTPIYFEDGMYTAYQRIEL